MPQSMRRIIRNRLLHSLILVAIIYLVGIVSVIAGRAEGLMQLTVYNLIFAMAVLLYNAESIDFRYWIWFMVCAIAGFTLEVIGVQTALIFGEYSYGNILGAAGWGVPYIIGLNWSFLVFASAALVHHLKITIVARAALAATIMVLYDIFLEPVAIHYGFWEWGAGPVPLQNYLAWWIIAFFMLLGAFRFVPVLRNKAGVYLLGIQTLFFITIIIKQGLPIH